MNKEKQKGGGGLVLICVIVIGLGLLSKAVWSPPSQETDSAPQRTAQATESKTPSDPVAEYWARYRGSVHTDADVAANLRAREAAARAKVSSEAANRGGEYAALVPHKLMKTWIAGIRTDKIGVDLLVESRRPTDRQLADLIRWYVGCNATVITVYDDAENARNRESMLASYMCGDANDCTQFERFMYPKGKDWSVKEVSFR